MPSYDEQVEACKREIDARWDSSNHQTRRVILRKHFPPPAESEEWKRLCEAVDHIPKSGFDAFWRAFEDYAATLRREG